MYPSDIHSGDRLRIRDWKDMAAEFEVDEEGDIECGSDDYGFVLFTTGMRHLCGKEFTASGCYDFGIIIISKEEKRKMDSRNNWVITVEMVEPVDDFDTEIEASNLESFLEEWL